MQSKRSRGKNGGAPKRAPVSHVPTDFARRLATLRVAKGWNQSELARQAALFMPDKKFNRDNISKYEKFTRPTPLHLNAIARALGVKPEELMPDKGMLLSHRMEDTELSMNTVGKNEAWLRVNQKVPIADAYKIIEILRKT